jgi:regulator of protease activity HflC (stomatin/prohibitin superfamily)
MIIPFIESVRKVDTRERAIQTPPQEMITKDNAVVTVDAIVYVEITDPVKATYDIQNPFVAVTSLAMTTLRAII